jgi:hypothetical protein
MWFCTIWQQVKFISVFKSLRIKKLITWFVTNHFKQFICRNNAEEALQKLNGTTIGKQTVRLSWGRNPANKQVLYHILRPIHLRVTL